MSRTDKSENYNPDTVEEFNEYRRTQKMMTEYLDVATNPNLEIDENVMDTAKKEVRDQVMRAAISMETDVQYLLNQMIDQGLERLEERYLE